MTTTLDSYAGLKATSVSTPNNNHRPDRFTPEKRHKIKAAFRLAINKSKSLTEARHFNKMRARFFDAQKPMTEDEAILAWLEVTLACKPGRPGMNPGNAKGKYHVAAA
jgi:hypothetical protein